ncbi:hypothetical protein AArcSl_2465 [Halalkaliarchaeum desulfuricum]|uniref:DUF7344 domain-containing protein n=1 Tax=Halalkaliarchaeum desulfuricum TaxID=2055893 RepID=A0A343TLW4_9EURY|nr:ArsR family transcriptional regulator [Halalkaliarchaeum desulfuricum]AUX10086.1 hypothetical protein AArcSl_2465 [Halalkaliarchaeum desulfuricum]
MGKLLATGALSRSSTEQNDNRPTDTNANDEETLTPDAVHQLLSNRRRRDVLQYLEDIDSTTTIGDLAVQIAAWEHDVSVTEVTSEQRKRVYISLYQTHLPKLAASGVIDYDRDRGRIALNGEAEELAVYLEDGGQVVRNWSRYYLTLACLSLGVIGLAWLGVSPFSTLSGMGYAGGVAIALLGLSVMHRYRTRRY